MTSSWNYPDGESSEGIEARTDDLVDPKTANAGNDSADADIAANAGSEDEKLAATDEISADDNDGMIAEGDEVDGGSYSEGVHTVTISCSDLQGKEIYKYEKDYSSNSSIYGMEATDDGTLYYICNEYGSESNDYQDVYYIICVDPAGNELWQSEISSTSDLDQYFYPVAIFANDNGALLVTSVGIENIDKQGNTSGMKQIDEFTNLGTVIKIKDNKYAALIYGDNEPALKPIDVENGKLGDSIAVPFSLYAYSVCSGAPAYDLVMSDQSGIYTFNIGDAAPNKIMDYLASDLVTTSINNIIIKDDTTFYGNYYDEETDFYGLYKFTKVDPSQVVEKEIIRLGGIWVENCVRSNVIKFNKSSDKYRIIINDYSNGGNFDNYQDVLQTVNNDIVTGNMPDIMMLDSSLNIENYIAKGVFADLNAFIDNDAEIKREDYLENVLNAYAYDGKTYAIIPGFQVNTLAGKKSIFGDKKGWTMAEFTEFMNAQDSDVTAMGLMTKQDFVDSMMYYCIADFIDRETGTAKFDSDEFINVLKYTEKYPKEIDYESFDDSYWSESDSFYRQDKTLLLRMSLYNFRDACYQTQSMFGEPINYIGYPSAIREGNSFGTESCIAINSKSKNQEAAWEFVRQFLLDDYQENNINCFPVKKSALEKMAKKAMEPQTYTDEDGNIQTYKDTYYIAGEEIEVDPPTQADIDQMMDVLTSVNKVTSYNDDVLNIVKEEAESFYNGQKSAEEVAKIIQGRVQIYVNENR